MDAWMQIADFRKVGLGVERPEDVVVGKDGRVFVSDHRCSVAEIHPDGSLTRMGPSGGAPNGINMDAEGRILIANFGIYDQQPGPLERFDPSTGRHETLVAEIGGRRLTSSNYPVLDGTGTIWCSHSTWAPTWPEALDGRPDGFIFALRPDGSAEIVASGLRFANGLALSADERWLFCAQTSGADVLRFEVLPGGTLGEGERYGPRLGQSTFGDAQADGPPIDLQGDPGYTDGVGLDADGNLWVCLPAANKIVAITPSGVVATVVADAGGDTLDHPTNVAWGGADLKDLYIGSLRAGYVLKGRSPVAGQPLVHQR